MAIGLTTELQAVNAMLAIIGEAPVNTLEDTGLLDAAMARQLLTDTSREVQSRGWSFNIDLGYQLVPTSPLPGQLLVPADAIQVDPVDRNLDYVVRGPRLWDRVNHTDRFTEATRCNITRLLPFDELPQAARQYITVRAGRVFQDRSIGSESRNGFTQKDELMALVALQTYEAETADYSMRDSDPVRGAIMRTPGGGWR